MRRRPYAADIYAMASGIAAIAVGAVIVSGCTAATAPRAATADRAAHAMGAAAEKPAARVLSVSPAAGTTGVNGTDQVQVTYSKPLPASAPFPQVSPAIAGTWQRDGTAATFTPAIGFPARTRVTVTAAASDGSARVTSSFTTGSYSTLRLQQLLAQLGYLPLRWIPAPHAGVVMTSPAQQLAAAYDPPAGSFSWVSSGWPGRLYSFWQAGSPNTLTRGAVTGFEADHGLPTDGDVGSKVWAALLSAAHALQVNEHGYSYAIADQHIPETLTIWHDGRRVFHSLANTGIGVRPTPVGTFPVYEKLPFQVMTGTNPDGSHYADPVKWVSYFTGGSAVHYFARGSYGSPQSLGCVEVPYDAARRAYPYLPYGTLVTVTG